MGALQRKQQSIGDLVWLIAHSDKAAFDRLYRRMSPRLFRAAERCLHDPDGARDIVLDTFAQVWVTAASYDSTRGSASQWIEMICRSRLFDRRRSVLRRRRARCAYEQLTGLNQAIVELDPADRLQRQQESMLLEHSIQNLSAARRQALRLSFFRELSHADIADTMQIPVGTVKTHIRRALLSLKVQTQHHFQ